MSGSVPPRLRCKGRCALSPAQVPVNTHGHAANRLCLRHRAWKPERVLAVTFSVKAAAEMRARLGQLGVGGGTGRSGSGAGTAGVTAATFHSAALHQLNSVWADICEAPFPHVIEDQRDVVSRAIIRATARTDADR